MEADKHSFLVSAVAISPHDASRVMKAFKKSARIKDEPKGSLITEAQRRTFFELLMNEVDHNSVTVCCANTKPVGKWAAATFTERDVFSDMLSESCLSMPNPTSNNVNIISDGGRYPGALRPSISSMICKTLKQQLSWDVNFSFADSRNHYGIQIADIIGNTMYRVLKDGECDLQEHELCGALAKNNQLILKATTFNGKKPDWL